MDHWKFLLVTRQLAAAAKILAKAGPEESRGSALKMRELFRRYNDIDNGLNVVATSNDESFSSTGHAALTMAGRAEFAAAHALIEQARSLLQVSRFRVLRRSALRWRNCGLPAAACRADLIQMRRAIHSVRLVNDSCSCMMTAPWSPNP